MTEMLKTLQWDSLRSRWENLSMGFLKISAIQLSVHFTAEPPHRVAFSNDTGTSIHCHANGNPAPKLEWTTATRSPLVYKQNLRKDLGNGTLHFAPFSIENYHESIHATAYICTAFNHRGVIISNEVHVRAVVKQHYEVQVYDEYVIEGNSGLLRCQIPSFVEEYIQVISWETDAGDVYTKTDKDQRLMVISKGDLYIADVQPKDSLKTFRCKTVHSLTGETKLSNLGRIIITDSRSILPPRITHTSTNVHIQQGERVELICTCQGFPVPNYRWYKVSENELLSVGQEERRLQWKSLLIFKYVQISDTGVYKCIASNNVGEDSTEIGLWVNGPMNIQVSPKLQTVDVGKSAAMTCIANGYPPLTSFTWFKNGVPVILSDKISFTAGKILTIAGVQREDQGIYQCFIVTSESSAFGAAELRLGKVLPDITAQFPTSAVLPDTKVALKCVASGNPTPVISWYLDGNPFRLVKAHTFVSANGDVTSFLNMSSIKMDDGGEYKCEAKNMVGISSHSEKLNVIGPPLVRPMRNVSVISGHDVAIHCKVIGYPISSISWRKGGLLLPIDPRQQTSKNGTLYIQSADKSSDGGIYDCTAKNDEGESSTGSVALLVTIPPQIAPIFFPPKLHIGTRARLQCVITEGDIPITFLWLKEGYPLTDQLELIVKQDDEFSSSLTFPSIHTRHNGNYTCVARNVAATANYSASLVVDVPPFWIINPVDTSVSLGNSVMLSCTADGFPKPQVFWKRVHGNNSERTTDLYYSNDNYKVFANGSFHIRKTSEQDEGNYLCNAQNGIGPGLNKVIHLSVEAGAYFDVKSQNVTSQKNETVTMLAIAKGDHPIKMIWKLNGFKINGNVDYRYSIKHQPSLNEVMSVLEIMNVDVRDSGVYTCFAFNSYGKDEAIFKLNVRDNPDPPENLRIMEHYSRYVQLTWTVPFDGGSAIKYYILQYKNGSDDWRNIHQNVTIIHPETTGIIPNLWPGCAYSFRVIAVNDVGPGRPSNGVGIRTPEEAPSGPPAGIRAYAETSQSIRVHWESPQPQDRNGELEGYNVGYKMYGTTEPFTYRTVIANNSGFGETLLIGLSKFAKYAISVRAYNRIGPGPSSEEVVVTTKEDVPSEPPGNIHCRSTSAVSIEITWDPPPKNSQHGLILSFKLTYCPLAKEFQGNGNKYYQLEYNKCQEKIFSSAVLSAAIHGLQKFTNHSIQILAATKMGDGVKSLPVFCHTKEDVPDAPADIKAITMSSNIILIAWKPPEYPNGKILTYNVYVKRANSSQPHKISTKKHVMDATDGFKFEARGLKVGETYDFWVTASTSVGEGSSTKVVTHTAQFKAGAKIAAFSDRIFSYWRSNVSLTCPATGMPSPMRTWALKNAPKTNARISQNNDGTLFISPVQQHDAGNYTCVARNIYGSDEITYELVVIGPPQPPLLKVLKVTAQSVWLIIQSQGNGGSPIRGYVLSYKELQGNWKDLNVKTKDETVAIENLQCGTVYEFFITAYNNVGASEPSIILPVSTSGTVPLAPKHEDIIHSNDTCITISLFRWPANECPIQYYSVQYRQKSRHSWIFVLDNVNPVEKKVTVTHLEPGASYEVKVTARNEAGTTVARYDVATYVKGYNGLHISHGNSTDAKPFYMDISIIIPATASAIATIAVLVGVCICIHHSRRLNGVNVAEITLHNKMLQSHSLSKEFEISEMTSTMPSYQHNQQLSDKTVKDAGKSISRDDAIWYPYPTQNMPINQVCNSRSSTFRTEDSIMLVMRAARNTTNFPPENLHEFDLDMQHYIANRQLHHQKYTDQDWDIEDGLTPSMESRPTHNLGTFNRRLNKHIVDN